MQKSIHLLVCFLALVGCQVASCNTQVRHLQLNDAHLIDTGASSYGLTSPELKQSGWQSISVNGDNALIFGQNCEQNIRSIQSLSDAEKNIIQSAKQQLQALETGGSPSSNLGASTYGVARYTLNGNGATSMSNSHNMHMSSFSNNQLSISKSDDNNFAVSRPGLPNNIAMILSMGSIVGFVYNDGQVQIKPNSCLQPAEQQLLQQIKAEVQQADQQFKNNMNQFHTNMNQFHNNMQNMQQQLQQNMRNMQQQMQANFGNMFGSGLPTSTANSGNGFNYNLGLGGPLGASASAGPTFAQSGPGATSFASAMGVPGAFAGTGSLLGNIFSGIGRQIQQLGNQRLMQQPFVQQQQQASFWPFGR